MTTARALEWVRTVGTRTAEDTSAEDTQKIHLVGVMATSRKLLRASLPNLHLYWGRRGMGLGTI